MIVSLAVFLLLWNIWNVKQFSPLFLTKVFWRLPRLQHQRPCRFCSGETAGIVENFLQMFKSLETVFGAYKNGGTFIQENLISWYRKCTSWAFPSLPAQHELILLGWKQPTNPPTESAQFPPESQPPLPPFFPFFSLFEGGMGENKLTNCS